MLVYQRVGVSINEGIPKWIFCSFMENPKINWIFWGYPHSWKLPYREKYEKLWAKL
jgi:hypothetical protein